MYDEIEFNENISIVSTFKFDVTGFNVTVSSDAEFSQLFAGQ